MRSSYNTSFEKSYIHGDAGDMPLLGSLRSKSSSDGAQISSRGKYSSSLSLYRAKGHEFEASSRHDLRRRSASASYRTVYPELQPPRSVRHVDSRFSKDATGSSWSYSLHEPDSLSFRVDSARGRIVGWPLAAMYSELTAEQTCTKENHAEAEEEEGEEEEDVDEYNGGTERQQRLQRVQLQEAVVGNDVRKKDHMTNLSKSCRMELGEFQLRRASARHGSEIVINGKVRSQSSRAIAWNEKSVRCKRVMFDEVNGFDLESEEKTLALSPRFKRGGHGKEIRGRKRDHDRESTAAAANVKVEEDGVASGECEITTVVRDRDFARSSRRSQLAVPFKWEESPGKPKMMHPATHRSSAKSMSRECMELNRLMEADALFRSAAKRATTTNQELGSSSSRIEQHELSGSAVLKSRKNSGEQRAVGERSHRYYDQVAMDSSFESIVGRSSRYLVSQDKETHIDLVAPAAARFLSHETSYLSPFATPLHHAFASPIAVPFKWEETPGKPKADSAASTPNDLQLPPRLAIAQERAAFGSGRFSPEDLRAHYLTNRSLSAILTGCFSPCLTGACAPPRQQAVPLLRPSSWGAKVSRSLPRKLWTSWSSRSPCSSRPQGIVPSEDCQIKHPKLVDEISHLSKKNRGRSPKFSARCSFSISPCRSKPRSTTSKTSELLKESQQWTHKVGSGAHEAAHHEGAINSSPTSTLQGPEAKSLSSHTSASNPSFSGYLDSLTQPESTPSRPSSHASFESLEQQQEDMDRETSTRSRSYSLRCPTVLDTASAGGDHDSQALTNFKPSDPSTTMQDLKDHVHESRGSQGSLDRNSLAFDKLSAANGNCFDSVPDFAARLGAAVITTARHAPNLRSCTSNSWTSAATENHLISCNGTQEKELYLLPTFENAACLDLPSPANTNAAAADAPSPANANAAVADAPSAANANAAAALNAPSLANSISAAVDMPCEPAIANAAALDTSAAFYAPSPANAAGLDLASSANAAAWDMPSSAGVNLMEQKCEALGGCKVSVTTRWIASKVRRQRVHIIFSMCKAVKRVLLRQRNRKVELKQCYPDDISLMQFAVQKAN